MIRNKIMPLMLAIVCCVAQTIQTKSKSFFVPRSVTTDSTFELALVNYHRYHTPFETDAQVYIKPFVMQSTNAKDLARYFLPHNKSSITLDESGNGDLDPLWFNLISQKDTFYTSTVTLAPVRTVGGAIFTLYGFYNCWWVGINTALMGVKTDLRLKETNRNFAGTLPNFRNACDGFNNAAWQAGRLPCHDIHRVGLDDIQFKVGYDFFRSCDEHFTFYGVGTFPTGKEPTSKTLFEPLVGSNHGSLGIGINGDYHVYDDCCHNLNIMGDLKYRYIFSATEVRSFDLLNNGDWSRYLLVVTQNAPLFSQPGINLLTVPVTVNPGGSLDIWLALHYQHCCFHGEVGYNFWARDAEKIHRKACIAQSFGIQTLALCSMLITSASGANITQTASGSNITVTDAVFTPITDADLDLDSAVHPFASSNKIYLSGAYTYNQISCLSLLFGLNISYEFANSNALSQWALWFTVGVAF